MMGTVASVRVVRVDLEQPEPVVARLEGHLDARERVAADARRDQIRTRYVTAHGALREILADATATAPADLVIDRTCAHCGHAAHGRPQLDGRTDVQFSLSHSDGVAVVAVTRAGRVGVDIEVERPRSRLDRLAGALLADDALARWQALDATERLGAFLDEWTAREAYLKGLGLGIARGVRGDEPADGWTIERLDLGPRLHGSIAIETTEPVEIETANWVPASTGTVER
jgi:4'-phosphopantetheinyl transferase